MEPPVLLDLSLPLRTTPPPLVKLPFPLEKRCLKLRQVTSRLVPDLREIDLLWHDPEPPRYRRRVIDVEEHRHP
jgi:hypothetical protein